MTKQTNLSLGALFLSAALFLTGCSQTESSETSANSSESLSRQNPYLTSLCTDSDLDTIYTLEYQEDILEQISSLKSENNYTPDNPLIIANPYGTNTTGLYVFFTTDTPSKTFYTVSAEGYEDFSRELNGGYTTEHEYLLIGSIPDCENTITLTLQGENGEKTESLELSYYAPSLKGSSENIQLDVTAGASTEEPAEGLYTMLGNRTEEDNKQVDFILLYDNNGTIRSEIPIKSYRSCNILFADDSISFSISAEEIAIMNRFGQITGIYNTDSYKLHHDYIWGSQNDILVLASEKNSGTEEDRILSIDRDTGSVTEIIDLSDLFKNYLDTLDTDPDTDEPLDWIHINSIRMTDEDSIIISSRETSSIIRIDDIYTDPSVSYIIGSSQFWQESGYDNLVYSQDGKFSLNAGQHCVEYEESEDLEDGQYYLYFYNNNNACSSTRDYDYSSDSGYDGTYCGVKGDESYYDKYLVDENARTFSLVERIPLTYSGCVSSVQKIGDHLLTDSGSAFTAVEFDLNNEKILTLEGTGDTWWYRVFKYDYAGFWFSSDTETD